MKSKTKHTTLCDREQVGLSFCECPKCMKFWKLMFGNKRRKNENKKRIRK